MYTAIIDACTLINLVKSGAAQEVLEALPAEVWFQGLVEDELVDIATSIEALVLKGLLRRYDGATLAASSVSTIAEKHRLGLGEAECIAICSQSGMIFISDDRKARIIAKKLLGNEEFIGLVGLLCQCIDIGRMTNEEAAGVLAQAQSAGGYLPDFDFASRALVA